MAMINCPECGKEISDKAAACPNCGCPINGSAATNTDRSEETAKFIDLAVKAIQGQNSEQVHKYCQQFQQNFSDFLEFHRNQQKSALILGDFAIFNTDFYKICLNL